MLPLAAQITALAANKLAQLPPDVLQQALRDSLQGVPTTASLNKVVSPACSLTAVLSCAFPFVQNQPQKLALRLKQLADARVLHVGTHIAQVLHM